MSKTDGEGSSSENVVWHSGEVGRTEREAMLGQRAGTVWFTGLSGSGKSTIAVEVERRLATAGRLCYRLDGDNLRHGLNGDLGFTESDRTENILEVYVEVPIEVAEQRDPKGLYRKARAGEIRGFTGIDQPYESPDRPELVLPTASSSVEASAESVVELLRVQGLIGPA
ncbi:MAG: adenylyl-sulfate kinase [Planctomycetota bacterium]